MTKHEHITLLEGRGTVQAIRHKMRVENSFGKKHLHLGDNLGMVLAFDRGRAKSVPLLLCCRRAAAFAIAGDSSFTHRWLPSEHNAADAASRKWEPETQEQPFSKTKAKEVISAICYPKSKSKSCLSQTTCSQLIGGSVGRAEECSPAKVLSWDSHKAGAQKGSASPRRVITGCKETGRGGDGEASEASTGPHFLGDCGNSTENKRRVPSQVEPLRVLLPNSEVEASKRERGGLRLDDLSKPSFFGRMGRQRGSQDNCRGHRQKAFDVWQTGPAKGKKGVARLEKPRSGGDSTSLGMAPHRLDCSHHPGESQAGRMHGDPLHVCDLCEAGGGLSAEKTRPGEERVSGSKMVHQPSPFRRSPGIQGGSQQRNFAFAQPGDSVAGTSSRVHHSNLAGASFSDKLHRSAAGVGAGASSAGAWGEVRSPVPAASLRSKLGSFQRVPEPPGSKASRKMGFRQQPETLRAACYGGPAIRETQCSAQAQGASRATNSGKHGPRKVRPQISKVEKPFLEIFSGCARLSEACAQVGIPCEAWDIMYGHQCDLLLRSNATRLLARIRAREFSAVHLGMLCIAWSRARRDDNRGPGPLRDDGKFLFGLLRQEKTP